MPKAYTIAAGNKKGGVGKTTTMLNLAASLSREGRVLVVDADEGTYSLMDWYKAEQPQRPKAALPFAAMTFRQYREGAKAHLQAYDYVLVDTRGGEAENELLTLAQQMDLLIVPSKPEATDMRALIRTLTPLRQAGASNYRVLLTQVPPAPSTDGIEARKDLQEAGVPHFLTSIRRSAAVGKSALAGVTLDQVKGDVYARYLASEYDAVATEILRERQAVARG